MENKKEIMNLLLEAKKELDFCTEDEMMKKGYNKKYYKPIVKKYKKNPIMKKFLKEIDKNIYDFKKKDLNKLGFCKFKNKLDPCKFEELYLVPLWFFRLLPKKTKLISIFNEETLKKDADDDIRMKCVAYGFKKKYFKKIK